MASWALASQSVAWAVSSALAAAALVESAAVLAVSVAFFAASAAALLVESTALLVASVAAPVADFGRHPPLVHSLLHVIPAVLAGVLSTLADRPSCRRSRPKSAPASRNDKDPMFRVHTNSL